MDDLFAWTRRKLLRQRVVEFLQNLTSVEDGDRNEDDPCCYRGCYEAARARGHYQHRGVWHPYHLCFTHFNQAHLFLDDLERYRDVDDLLETAQIETLHLYHLLKERMRQ